MLLENCPKEFSRRRDNSKQESSNKERAGKSFTSGHEEGESHWLHDHDQPAHNADDVEGELHHGSVVDVGEGNVGDRAVKELTERSPLTSKTSSLSAGTWAFTSAT